MAVHQGAPPNRGLTDGRAFTLAELAPLTEERFADLSSRTLQRMKLDGAEVFRFTIWRRGIMVESKQGKPIIEVRAGKDQGWTSGWVVYELDGTEIDVVLP